MNITILRIIVLLKTLCLMSRKVLALDFSFSYHHNFNKTEPTYLLVFRTFQVQNRASCSPTYRCLTSATTTSKKSPSTSTNWTTCLSSTLAATSVFFPRHPVHNLINRSWSISRHQRTPTSNGVTVKAMEPKHARVPPSRTLEIHDRK